MATPSSKYVARIIVAPSKNTVGDVLSISIVKSCQSALESRDAFTIALSGGSLPSFLQSLPKSFEIAGVDPQWGKWHVLLADERCVESTHEDSNLGSIQKNFTSHVPIPTKHVYGIKESLISESSLAIAQSYEDNVVKPLLEKSGGMLDCVVLVSSLLATNEYLCFLVYLLSPEIAIFLSSLNQIAINPFVLRIQC
mmetsp:Transcript_22982/g.46981  ORF Transcript_22982/g.46981 Transcript_22982/m.46981 type:complete len:196 (-) Transcript_22982:1174-1761(-)